MASSTPAAFPLPDRARPNGGDHEAHRQHGGIGRSKAGMQRRKGKVSCQKKLRPQVEEAATVDGKQRKRRQHYSRDSDNGPQPHCHRPGEQRERGKHNEATDRIWGRDSPLHLQVSHRGFGVEPGRARVIGRPQSSHRFWAVGILPLGPSLGLHIRRQEIVPIQRVRKANWTSDRELRCGCKQQHHDQNAAPFPAFSQGRRSLACTDKRASQRQQLVRMFLPTEGC